GAKSGSGSHALLGVASVGAAGGHVAVLGDSNCLDSSHMQSNCYEFLAKLLERTVEGKANGIADGNTKLAGPWIKPQAPPPPRRRPDVNFTQYSYVLANPLRCWPGGDCQASADSPSCGDFFDPSAKSPMVPSPDPQPTANAPGSASRDPASPEPRSSLAPGALPAVHASTGSREPKTASGPSATKVGSEPLRWPPNATAIFDKVSKARKNPFSMGFAGAQTVMLICVVGLAAVLSIWQFARRARNTTPRAAALARW
ncbi:hypothetical protein QJQ45_015030, partial [Haematococcus lacustris]